MFYCVLALRTCIAVCIVPDYASVCIVPDDVSVCSVHSDMYFSVYCTSCFSVSPDMNLSGLLGSKHHLTDVSAYIVPCDLCFSVYCI